MPVVAVSQLPAALRLVCAVQALPGEAWRSGTAEGGDACNEESGGEALSDLKDYSPNSLCCRVLAVYFLY